MAVQSNLRGGGFLKIRRNQGGLMGVKKSYYYGSFIDKFLKKGRCPLTPPYGHVWR
jgi:hypothetical protein